MMPEIKEVNGLDFWSTFGKRLVYHMDLKSGTRVLDVGTGGGACLLPAAEAIGPTGRVIGIDNWKRSIDEVLENIKKSNLTNASAEFMDARKITFKDNSFDYILCGFIGFGGIYNFQNQKYLKENEIMKHMFRILKTGGKAGFSTWEAQGELDHLRILLQDYLRKYTSMPDEETKNLYISYSKENKKGYKKILQDVGFNNIEIFIEEFNVRYNNVESWFNVMKQSGWILEEYLGKNESNLLDFKEKMLVNGLESFKQDDGSLIFKKSIIFAFGTK